MARYREIYEDLRQRVLSGEFPVGERLPSIADLQEHYDVPGLNTIRQAQQLLVDDGLVETRQGVGAFVISHEPTDRAIDVVAELRATRAAIDRALTALAGGGAGGARYGGDRAAGVRRPSRLPGFARLAMDALETSPDPAAPVSFTMNVDGRERTIWVMDVTPDENTIDDTKEQRP